MSTERRTRTLAGIEYAGLPGSSKECKDAIARLLQHGDIIQSAKILTQANTHGLILSIGVGDFVAVKTGFASGYGGEGPSTFSYVLRLLEAHKVRIDEFDVEPEVLERLDNSALKWSDLKRLERQRPVRPSRWYDYIREPRFEKYDERTLWGEFPLVMPFAAIDPRLIDLALVFWDAPNDRIFDGYRRLEELIRQRTRLKDKTTKLFAAAFLGAAPVLRWRGCDAAEQEARAALFRGTFTAHRNPRAHGSVSGKPAENLSEFLLLNHLYRLESQATASRRNNSKARARSNNIRGPKSESERRS